MNGDLERKIADNSQRIYHRGGRPILVLKDRRARDIAEDNGVDMHAVYRGALGQGICPYRYLKNMGSLTLEDQLHLARARVAVVGAGGLGGQILLTLGRIGVGNLVVVDQDRFDETNLNRQALSSTDVIGKPKSEVAAAALRSVNPAVRIIPHHRRLDTSCAEELLSGADVVVDALDTIADRFILERAAGDLGVPFVHGALAGFEGRIMTLFPGDAGMAALYGREEDFGGGGVAPEDELGVLAPTASVVGSLQAVEVVKVILGRGPLMRKKMVHLDLEEMVLETFSLTP